MFRGILAIYRLQWRLEFPTGGLLLEQNLERSSRGEKCGEGHALPPSGQKRTEARKTYGTRLKPKPRGFPPAVSSTWKHQRRESRQTQPCLSIGTSEWTQLPYSPVEKPGEDPRADPEIWGVRVQVHLNAGWAGLRKPQARAKLGDAPPFFWARPCPALVPPPP